MKKTKQETIDELRIELLSIVTLYKSKCVNWIGKTKDTNELYSEIISSEIMQTLKEFDKIPIIKRTDTYCKENHTKIEIDIGSPRKEEIFAKRIAHLNIGELGKIIDYQIPLKDTLVNEGLGKIDLISFNEKTKVLYLIELKYEGNNETLLRASLECYTYYKIVNRNKLIKDCLNNQKFDINNPEDIKVIPAVLVTPKCNAFIEKKLS